MQFGPIESRVTAVSAALAPLSPAHQVPLASAALWVVEHELGAAHPSGTTASKHVQGPWLRDLDKGKVELEGDAVTDHDATGLERHIPGQAPVAPLQAS